MAKHKKKIINWYYTTDQFDSRVDRVKKRGGVRNKLANGTGGGAGDQPENFVGGERTYGDPMEPIGCLSITIPLWSACSDSESDVPGQKGLLRREVCGKAFWEKQGTWWRGRDRNEGGMVTVHGWVRWEAIRVWIASQTLWLCCNLRGVVIMRCFRIGSTGSKIDNKLALSASCSLSWKWKLWTILNVDKDWNFLLSSNLEELTNKF